ncbi:heme lyase CcmF/NrfE family subunit [Methylocapsa sp. S129]|uniref:heme lyase CcmF/NrfE family subunit n=1 Tax=Methylocapsa sp. S129 TaxID=1641869 RepID=UPI00131DFECF|nr:heme lyase CcmF/NrfE family subunit [Methylocapsa sp. S129]
MIVEIGHYALTLALALALVQAIVPLWGTLRGDEGLASVGQSCALGQFVAIALSFGALVQAHLASDFSVLNVAENSHSAVPTIYKISGVWGNHEGSMLLWVLILAFFGALVAGLGRGLPLILRANVLAVQGFISAAFLAFILLTSNPFARLSPAPFEGRDLNPVLQDLGLAIHPPLLYLGYVGFSIVFSFAAAALIEGRIDAAWARFVRPFALVAWCFLTLGIAMGSYWAYYTLGWGGFWFWDPVENASLMPWLAGTAFVHSVAVMEKRDALKVWTIFLAILAFSFSLLGTFLVRSGVLTSVHAFASDPSRGVFILAILALFIGGALALFAWRAPMLKRGGLFAPISREGALVLNNLLLTTTCAGVLIGTLYPLALEQLTGEKITVGAPFFNMTCGVLLLMLCVVVPFGQSLAWKRGDLLGVAQRLSVAAAIGLCIFIALFATLRGGPVLAPIAAGLAIYIILGSLSEIAARVWRRGASLGVLFSRARGLPLSAWGSALAHIGVGVTLLGLAATAFGAETIASMRVGEPQNVGPYQVTFQSVASRPGPNYSEVVAKADIRSGGTIVASVEPAKRFFSARQTSTTQAGIATLWFGQLYISIGDQTGDGAVAARLYWKPLVTFIWLGACLMAFGGALSLADRRLRIGAPAPARSGSPAIAAR